MPKIYDEQTDYTAAGDNNQNTSASIQPVAGGENLWENVLNRSPENLRKRTEVLRQVVDDLRYYADYDRAFVCHANNTQFSFISAVDGFVLQMQAVGSVPGTGGPLVIYPALAPHLSGGRVGGARMFINNSGSWRPYAGTLGANDLTFVATRTFTGMRGYADTDDFANPQGVSLGANRLTVSLVANPAIAGGVATMQASVTGNPKVNITITYGTAAPTTTIQNIIDFVATDTNSQTTYGLSNIIRAVSSAAAPTTTAPPTITGGVFQGGYDAEGFVVNVSDLTTFFNALDTGGIYHNRLANDGEGLAISFVPGPVERGPGSLQGGRRQSLSDWPTNRTGANLPNQNVALDLFNTSREPEKIPGSIPIGKRIGNTFVFIDGTVIGSTPISLGESTASLTRLASTTAPTGASLVGYGGSGPFNPDAGGTSVPSLFAGTLESTLDLFVSALAEKGANQSAARRIGAEGQAGAVTNGNIDNALSVADGSLREQTLALLNGTFNGRNVGINARVNENGHRMQGLQPLEKVFSDVPSDAGGSQFLRSVLNPGSAPGSAGVFATNQPQDLSKVVLKPLTFDNPPGYPGAVLLEEVPAVAGGFGNEVLVTMTPTTATATAIFLDIQSASASPHCIVRLSKASAAIDGYYFASQLITVGPGPFSLFLKNLDGTPFTQGLAVPLGSRISFYITDIEGSSETGALIRRNIVPTLFKEELFGAGNIRRATVNSQVQFIETVSVAVRRYQDTLPVPGQSGALVAAIIAQVSPGVVYVSGLTGMTPNSVGRILQITNSTNPIFNGKWLITAYVSPNTVNISFPTPVPVLLSPTIDWDELYVAARSTDNIPIYDDKRLLSGIENGSPVDATANHHHGSVYASFTPTLPPTTNSGNWSGISVAAGPPPGTLFPVTAPVGFLAVGVVIYYEIEVVPLAAGPVNGLLVVFDINSDFLMKFEFVYTATGVGDTRKNIGHLFVPLQESTPGSGGEFYVWRNVGNVNVDIGLSTYTLKYIAKSFVPV